MWYGQSYSASCQGKLNAVIFGTRGLLLPALPEPKLLTSEVQGCVPTPVPQPGCCSSLSLNPARDKAKCVLATSIETQTHTQKIQMKLTAQTSTQSNDFTGTEERSWHACNVSGARTWGLRLGSSAMGRVGEPWAYLGRVGRLSQSSQAYWCHQHPDTYKMIALISLKSYVCVYMCIYIYLYMLNGCLLFYWRGRRGK